MGRQGKRREAVFWSCDIAIVLCWIDYGIDETCGGGVGVGVVRCMRCGLTSDMGNYIPAVPATSYRSQDQH